MSAAKADRKSDIEGVPMGGGPVKGAAELTGGALNYTFIIFNLLAVWLAWALLLGSLSAFQNRLNHSQLYSPAWRVTDGSDDFSSYTINSGHPALQPGRLLRFEWFVFFLTPIIIGTVSLALIGRITRQTRSMTTGWMTVLLILSIYCTNRIYDLSHFSTPKYHKAVRSTLGSFILLDIGLFGLIYLLGLEF